MEITGWVDPDHSVELFRLAFCQPLSLNVSALQVEHVPVLRRFCGRPLRNHRRAAHRPRSGIQSAAIVGVAFKPSGAVELGTGPIRAETT